MEKKEDYINRIKNSPLFKQALSTAQTEEEKKKIIAIALDMAEQIADAYVPMIEKIKNDPEFAQNFKDSLRKYAMGQKDVVINKEK